MIQYKLVKRRNVQFEPSYAEIKEGNLKCLCERMYSEHELKKLAERVKEDSCEKEICLLLLRHMLENDYEKNYDWNTGSIVQHFDAETLIAEIEKIKNKNPLYESIGLSWVLGEFKIKNITIIKFLYEVMDKTKNSEAWWRAAFSLEKIGVEDAVNLLKRSLKKRGISSLQRYLQNIQDKKSVIGILLFADNEAIKTKIYPVIKEKFINSSDTTILINCIWLIGRLKLIDKEIYLKIKNIIETSKNYELVYYTFFALQENMIPQFGSVLEKHINSKDPLIRKMVVRGLSNLGEFNYLKKLEKALYQETDEKVISEITQAIYKLKNPDIRNKLIMKQKYFENENGLISDETDKWYGDPSIYNVFSEAEDPENLCFDLICQKICKEKIQILNPIDLASGTGRLVRQIVQKMNFEGILYAADINPKMTEFLEKTIKRRRGYVHNIKIITSPIKNLKIKNKSTFIISSFGFPSKIFDGKLCLKELKKIYELLDENGFFVTIGWDETFNDELNLMWFKYIPDSIKARNFEEWRLKRCQMISSPRNCNLTWFKKGISVPLQFSSLSESAYVIGHLFGRDAAKYVIDHQKTRWSMSMGITYDTKKELRKIIKKSEKENARS